MEPRARVELATCRLRIGCSTTELPRPLIINDLFLCLTSFSERLSSIFHRSLSVAALRCPIFTRNCPTCLEQSRALRVNDHSASAPETLSLFLERTTESDRAPDERKIAK